MTKPIGDALSEFPLVPNNPETRLLTLALSIPFLVLLTCVLVLFAVGVAGAQEVSLEAIFLIVVGSAVIWNVQQNGRGWARIDSSGLLVRTRGQTQQYPWADVADVQLTSFAERGAGAGTWAGILRWSRTRPFVELRLKRSSRLGLWPGRYGTRVLGLPLIGGTAIALFVADPASFVQLARNYLEQD